MNEINPLICPVDLMGTWRLGFYFGLTSCLLYLIFRHCKMLPIPARILWAYQLALCIFTLEFPIMHYKIWNRAFESQAGMTFAESLLIPLFAMSLPARTRESILKWFGLVIVAEIALMWSHIPGPMVAMSFDCALMALYLPLAPPALKIASLITIARFHSGTALLILGVYTIALLWRRAWKFVPAFAIFLLVCTYLQIDPYNVHPPIFSYGWRISYWSQMMTQWWHQLGWMTLFGTGPGTFFWLAALLHNDEPVKFMFMHSDWLQITYELGFTGLTLALATVTSLVARSKANAQQVAMILACCAFAMSYHPTRFFPSAFLVTLILSRSLVEKDREV